MERLFTNIITDGRAALTKLLITPLAFQHQSINILDKSPNFDSSIKDCISYPPGQARGGGVSSAAHIPSRAFFTSRPSARRTADCHNQAVSQGCRSSDPPRQARAPATQPQTETDLPTRQNANLNCYLLESYSA